MKSNLKHDLLVINVITKIGTYRLKFPFTEDKSICGLNLLSSLYARYYSNC